MLSALLAIFASVQTVGSIQEVPTDLSTVPVAQFSSPLATPPNMRKVVKKLTRDCKPTSKSDVLTHYRVDILLFGTGSRALKQVTPISMGCPKLEEYAARHFADAAKRKMPVSKDGKGSWYRSSMSFYW